MTVASGAIGDGETSDICYAAGSFPRMSSFFCLFSCESWGVFSCKNFGIKPLPELQEPYSQIEVSTLSCFLADLKHEDADVVLTWARMLFPQ